MLYFICTGFYVTTTLICTTGILCDNDAIRYPTDQNNGNGLPVYPNYLQTSMHNAFAVNRNAESRNQEQQNLNPNTAPLPFYHSSQGSNTVDEFEYDNVIKFGWKLFQVYNYLNKTKCSIILNQSHFLGSKTSKFQLHHQPSVATIFISPVYIWSSGKN